MDLSSLNHLIVLTSLLKKVFESLMNKSICSSTPDTTTHSCLPITSIGLEMMASFMSFTTLSPSLIATSVTMWRCCLERTAQPSKPQSAHMLLASMCMNLRHESTVCEWMLANSLEFIKICQAKYFFRGAFQFAVCSFVYIFDAYFI